MNTISILFDGGSSGNGETDVGNGEQRQHRRVYC